MKHELELMKYQMRRWAIDNSRETPNGCAFALFAVMVILIIWIAVSTYNDIATGEEKLILAVVTNKEHESELCSSPMFNEKGQLIGQNTYYEDYYWLFFKRQDGVSYKKDVYRQGELDKYQIGQKLVVRVIIGGKSKQEYYQGFWKFEGVEKK